MTTPSRSRALLALLLIAPAPSLGALMAFWFAPGTTLGVVAYSLGKTWLYGFPLLWHLLIDRQHVSISRPTLRGLMIGVLSGLAISAAIIIVYIAFARQRIEPALIRDLTATNGLDTPVKYLAAALWLSLVNALLEEYAFRWFITSQCRRLMKLAPAIILSVLIFAAHHLIVLKAFFAWDIALLGTAGVFAGGATWSMLYLRFNSIWPGYVSHLLVDLAVMALGWQIIGLSAS